MFQEQPKPKSQKAEFMKREEARNLKIATCRQLVLSPSVLCVISIMASEERKNPGGGAETINVSCTWYHVWWLLLQACLLAE